MAKCFELRLPLEVVRVNSQGVSYVGETTQIGSGGMLFISEADLAAGDQIECVISLGRFRDRSVMLHCRGMVLGREVYSGWSELTVSIERYEFARQKTVELASVAVHV